MGQPLSSPSHSLSSGSKFAMPPVETQRSMFACARSCSLLDSRVSCFGPCFPIYRRITRASTEGTTTAQWVLEGEVKRREEWTKASIELDRVLRSCGLNGSPTINSKKCRLLIILELIGAYWDIDQIIRQRSSYVEECKRWILYTRSSRIQVQGIIREMTNRFDGGSGSTSISPSISPSGLAVSNKIVPLIERAASLRRSILDPLLAASSGFTKNESKDFSLGGGRFYTEEIGDGMETWTAEFIADLVHASFPNISKAIVIQELGFIHRSVHGEKQGTLNSGNASQSTNLMVHCTEQPEEQQSFDAEEEVSFVVVELFFKNQLPMFLEKEIIAENFAIQRLLQLHNTATAWMQHMRKIIRKRYVEIVAKQLDVQEASTIKLTKHQLNILFDANESLDVYDYLQKSQKTLVDHQQRLIPFHLEPGLRNERIKMPLPSPLTSITATSKRDVLRRPGDLANEHLRSLDVIPLFPAPPVVPSPPFIEREPQAVTFKLVETFFHKCLSDRSFFNSVWDEYREIDPVSRELQDDQDQQNGTSHDHEAQQKTLRESLLVSHLKNPRRVCIPTTSGSSSSLSTSCESVNEHLTTTV